MPLPCNNEAALGMDDAVIFMKTLVVTTPLSPSLDLHYCSIATTCIPYVMDQPSRPEMSQLCPNVKWGLVCYTRVLLNYVTGKY